jgi:hypothetical protein
MLAAAVGARLSGGDELFLPKALLRFDDKSLRRDAKLPAPEAHLEVLVDVDAGAVRGTNVHSVDGHDCGTAAGYIGGQPPAQECRAGFVTSIVDVFVLSEAR